MRISGVAFTDSSDSAYRLFTGSTKKTCSPRTGSLPSSRKRTTPMTTVTASASSGDASDIAFDGCGRASSFSMLALLRALGPQPRHPRADALDRRLGGRHRRRHPALRDDDEPVADLEQLVELLADDEE